MNEQNMNMNEENVDYTKEENVDHTKEENVDSTKEENVDNTLQIMQLNQSVYATVETGTAPLLRHSTTSATNKLFNALNGSAKPVKDYLGEDVDITDIVITSAEVPSIREDDDSERVSKPCVHFFTLDGEHISSISNGIIKATKMLLACGLVPTEDNPITIKFTEVPTKKGTAHSFEMV